MKYVTAVGPQHTELKDTPMPVINDDQVLIRLKYVGVCRSEHDSWKDAKPGQAFGHEPMGYIAEVGKNVKGWAVGDRVCGLWGSTLPGAGAMIEYTVANPKTSLLMHVPDNLNDDEVIIEPLSCIFSAVSKVRKGVAGSSIAVVGCGYMGCGAISLLKACGAYVVAIDILPESLENAKKFGADEVYLSDEALERFDAVKSSIGVKGFDAVMEWGETNESLDLAIHITKMCGQLCIGAYHTGGKRLVDVQRLNVMAIDCLSTHPREADINRQSAQNSLRMLASGEWNFRHVPTMVYPRNQFDRAQKELDTKFGKFMKAIIDMTVEDGEPYLL